MSRKYTNKQAEELVNLQVEDITASASEVLQQMIELKKNTHKYKNEIFLKNFDMLIDTLKLFLTIFVPVLVARNEFTQSHGRAILLGNISLEAVITILAISLLCLLILRTCMVSAFFRAYNKTVGSEIDKLEKQLEVKTAIMNVHNKQFLARLNSFK